MEETSPPHKVLKRNQFSQSSQFLNLTWSGLLSLMESSIFTSHFDLALLAAGTELLQSPLEKGHSVTEIPRELSGAA